MDDVILNKAATIERCLLRVEEEYARDPSNLATDVTRQDSIANRHPGTAARAHCRAWLRQLSAGDALPGHAQLWAQHRQSAHVTILLLIDGPPAAVPGEVAGQLVTASAAAGV